MDSRKFFLFASSIASLTVHSYIRSASISTGSLPKALTSSTEHLFLVTAKDIQSTSLSTKKIISTLPISYSATSIAVTKNGSIVAVGSEDLKVYLYEHSDNGFKLLGFCELRNQVTALAFNPSNENSLAVGESTGKVVLFDVEKRELILSRWVYQSGRITSLSWKQDGKFIASASLDQSIFVYSVDKPSEVVSVKVSLHSFDLHSTKLISYDNLLFSFIFLVIASIFCSQNVHSGGVAQIVWSTTDELISAGADACIKKFSIKLSA